MLEDLGREGFEDFPEPPSETAGTEEKDEEGLPSEGDSVEDGAAEERPSPED
jgi:hypothetical protein